MKICQPHWDQLRKAVEEAGLAQFISSGGEEVIRRITTELESEKQKPTAATFDPLMNANFAIWSNALSMGGLYLMGQDENDNPYCPICESEKQPNGYKADWWIKHAVEDQVNRAIELGLMGRA